MNLRVRLTLMSSMILSIACVILTLAVNLSADKAITPAIPIIPSISEYQTEWNTLVPAALVPTTQYEVFRIESIMAMIFVVFIYLFLGKLNIETVEAINTRNQT